MKLRSAIKTDPMAQEHHRQKVDALGTRSATLIRTSTSLFWLYSSSALHRAQSARRADGSRI